jgi:hypothetical protein
MITSDHDTVVAGKDRFREPKIFLRRAIEII